MSFRLVNRKTQKVLTWQGGQDRIFKLLGDVLVHAWQYGFSPDEWRIVETERKEKVKK